MRLALPLLLLSSLATFSWGAEVRYANDVANLLPGARMPALAGTGLGFGGDITALVHTPSALLDLRRPELMIHHAALYQDLDARQDEFFLAVPLDTTTVLAAGVARVGVSGIIAANEGEVPDFTAPNTFGTSNWVVSAALARSWFRQRLQVGVTAQFLGRDEAQLGLGIQTQGSLVWKDPKGWQTGLRAARGFGSFVTWENGRKEFSPADVVWGVGYHRALPYFYGVGAVALETPGLVQGEGSATFTSKDVRPWKDPWLGLRASRFGGEFRFDFGGVLRAGGEIQSIVRLVDFLQDSDKEGLLGESRGSLSVGVGYLWQNRVGADYALVNHPELGTSHRVALSLYFGAANPVVPPPVDELEPDAVRSDAPLADLPAPTSETPNPSSRAVPVDSVQAAPGPASTAAPATPAPPESAAPAQPAKPADPAPVAPKSAPAATSDDEWDAPERSDK